MILATPMETMPPVEAISPETTERVRQLERELVETEKALAQEAMEHSRTKETLAYTRGLLDRADRSEAAIHKYLDRQEERHQAVVVKLEEKVVDANRKIATIARELGAKEERVALLMGPGRLPGPAGSAPAALAPLPLDVPVIWSALGTALTLGIWAAPGWTMAQSASATAALWSVIAWFVLKFWVAISRSAAADSPRARRLGLLCRAAATLGGLAAVAFLALALFEGF